MRVTALVSTLFAIAPAVTAATSSQSSENNIAKRQWGGSSSSSSSSSYSSSSQSVASLLCTYLGMGCDLTSDEFNCGSRGNICPTMNIANGGGSSCNNGVCGASCNNLFDWNPFTRICQNVAADVNNCGKCGNVCSITGASTTKCSAGNCLATACSSGYTLSNGACNKIIDVTSDPQNCGKIGNACSSSWSNGQGATCQNGVCRATTCNNLFDWDFGLRQCRDVSSDSSNCGACGSVCSFPNGKGSCKAGVCTLSSCSNSFYAVNGVCTQLNLQTDSNNCGTVGNKCTFTRGSGSCSGGKCLYTTCGTGYKLSPDSTSCVAINYNTDVNNCGSDGNKCAATYANGGPGVCTNGVCGTNCNPGFGFSTSANGCIGTTSDTKNCGSVGNVCPSTGGTATCTNGVCKMASCTAPGSYLVNGACVNLDLTSDTNNCGSVGNKCQSSWPHGSGSICSSGVCRPSSCLGLWDWNPATSSCIDVSTDKDNCGSCGAKCAFTNGLGVCSSGSCTLQSCNSGFQKVNGACVQMDINSDVNNCGGVGRKCSFSNGAGTCSNGVCTYTSCTSPYALVGNTCSYCDLNTDVNNCGAVGNKCPSSYANGGFGFCLLGKCQSLCTGLFDFDFTFGYCRDVSSDTNNCGRCGATCNLPGASSSICRSGKCYATSCSRGYTLVNGACQSVDTTCDPGNCGSIGHQCDWGHPLGQGVCSNSQCRCTGCPPGYSIVNNKCTPNGNPSQRARLAKKDSLVEKRTLCPAGETACPIVGSASFETALSHHFSAQEDFTAMSGAGGFECLDTMQSLESCGGCASTGEGQDCTKIRGAVGVGCDNGACVVFSCLAGWRPNIAGTKCVRAHPEHQHGQNGTRSAARRHLHTRHSVHHS